jgi:hypothetical protein
MLAKNRAATWARQAGDVCHKPPCCASLPVPRNRRIRPVAGPAWPICRETARFGSQNSASRPADLAPAENRMILTPRRSGRPLSRRGPMAWCR